MSTTDILRWIFYLHLWFHMANHVQLVSGLGVYINCFNDDSSGQAYLMSKKAEFAWLNQQTCENHCKDTSLYTYLGLKAGNECWCGNTYATYGYATALTCNVRCAGYSGQSCGGWNQLAVYSVCPLGYWGTYCDRKCNCKNQAVCMRNDGLCAECAAGYFDPACDRRCYCLGGVPCAKQYGYCPDSRCAPGWMNHNCATQGTCPVGSFGTVCEYQCHCKYGDGCWRTSGYCPSGCAARWSGSSCNITDVDECATGAYRCPQNSVCQNTPGSYRCSCRSGYIPASNGHSCNDIDECVTNQYISCAHGRDHCHNNDGSYTCTCRSGFSLDSNGYSCRDIDECATSKHQCSAGDDHCHNEDDGYTCSCEDGYNLMDDGNNCEDNDECADGGAHLCSQTCINTPGAYTCSCHPGFQLTSEDDKMCRECNEGRYGVECTFNCSSNCKDSKCHGSNGTCMVGCIEGWLGDTCLEKSEQMTGDGSGIPIYPMIGGVVGGLLVIVIIVLVVLLIRRKRKKQNEMQREANGNTEPDLIVDMAPKGSSNPAYCQENIKMKQINEQKGNANSQNEENMYSKDTKKDPLASESNEKDTADIGQRVSPPEPAPKPATTMPIDVGDIKRHIAKQKLHDSAGFLKEFQTIPAGRLGTCTVAAIPELKPKNKFKNILPYDHNRVLLAKHDDVPHSDYINASYVEANNEQENYIAAQGPQKPTVNDFWRMVWELEVSLIVMLTNPVENGKKKCEEYWPPERECPQEYGDVTVNLLGEEEMPDFCKRMLSISCGGTKRAVKQFHFKTWPDHNVPSSPTGLLKMLYKVRSEPQTTKPIIVHCSAGVGRTGTFISIDRLLKQADRDGRIDALACVSHLRKSRMEMVQTKLQYEFVHDAVLEALSTQPTCFPCDAYNNENSKKTIMATTAKHFQFIHSTTKPLIADDVSVGLDSANKSKNRSPDIIPGNFDRVYLSTSTSAGSDYINAVYVNGLRHTDEYIATQVPLENTVGDFWRMVAQYRCTSILVLEKDKDLEKLSPLLPHTSEPLKFGDYTISLTDTNTADGNQVKELTLYRPGSAVNTTEEPVYENKRADKGTDEEINLAIKVLVVSGEVTEQSLVQCASTIHKWQQSAGTPAVVMCRDGVAKCGLYLATSILINMINHEQEVDVFYAVRTIRQRRPQFITSQEQYKLLHLIAAAYLRTFDIYANFN